MPYRAAPSTDQVSRGLSRLLEQYKKKPFIVALTKSYLNRIQELENAAWEVIRYRYLSDAEGVQLDSNGAIVGRGRNNLNDADFLVAIRAQIRINRSCGTPEDMIAVTALSLPAGYVFVYAEAYPAVILISVYTALSVTAAGVLFESLTHTKAGGVRLLLDYSLVAPSNTFTWAPGLFTVADTLHGWGDSTDPSVGGLWSSVISSG